MQRRLLSFLYDWYLDLVLLCLGLFLLLESSEYLRTARTFPHLVLVLLLFLTGLDVVLKIAAAGRKSPRGDGQAEEDTPSRPGKMQNIKDILSSRQVSAIYVILLMFLFLFVVQMVGFMIGAFAFVLFAAWSLGYRKGKPLFFSALAITAFLYLIFVVIMKSNLPQGLLIEYALTVIA